MTLCTALLTTLLVFTSTSAFALNDCTNAPKGDILKKVIAYYEKNEKFIRDSKYSAPGSKCREDDGKIVFNDYTAKPAMMYVLSKDGTCRTGMKVNWGSGDGGAMNPGCGEGEHLTPPGFHITTETAGGGKYPYPNGFGLVSCEGQKSIARGVKVHPAESGGTGTSWGCPSVAKSDFEQVVLTKVCGRSLLYNHFGDKKAEDCKDMTSTDTCTPESAPTGGGGGSGEGKANKSSGAKQ